MSKVAAPVFVRDIETAEKLIASAKGKAVVNIFILNHEDAVRVIDKLADHVAVQPIKHFGDKEVYVEAKGQLNEDQRKKYMPKLAGQVFTSTYQGVPASLEITQDGLFKSLVTGKICKSPSTALSVGWEGRVKGRGQVNGYYHPKNKNGKSIDEELKKYVERGE